MIYEKVSDVEIHYEAQAARGLDFLRVLIFLFILIHGVTNCPHVQIEGIVLEVTMKEACTRI